jgi:hypothetical protein
MSNSWYGIPEELTEPQKEFMRKNELSFSSGYIGMLRCYHKGNTTIWQSSSGMAPIVRSLFHPEGKMTFPTHEQLHECGREFLKKAMALSPKHLKEMLETHVRLF